MLLVLPLAFAGENPFIESKGYGTWASQNFISVGINDFGGALINISSTSYYMAIPETPTKINIYNESQYRASVNLPSGLTLKNVSGNQIEMDYNSVDKEIVVSFLATDGSKDYFVSEVFQLSLDNLPDTYLIDLNGNTQMFNLGCDDYLCLVQSFNASGNYAFVINSLSGDYDSFKVSDDTGTTGLSSGYSPLRDSTGKYWFFDRLNASTDYFSIKIYDSSYDLYTIIETDDYDGYQNVILGFTASPYEITEGGQNYFVFSYAYSHAWAGAGSHYGMSNNLINSNYEILRNLNTKNLVADAFFYSMKGGLAWDDVKNRFILEHTQQRMIYDFSFNLLNTTYLPISYSGSISGNKDKKKTYLRLYKLKDRFTYGYNMFVNSNLYNDTGLVPVFTGNYPQSIINFGDSTVVLKGIQGQSNIYLYGTASYYSNQLPEVVDISLISGNPTIYQRVFIGVNAIDYENDSISYGYVCDWDDNNPTYPIFYSAESLMCVYSNGGLKKIRVFVTDAVHGLNYMSYKDLSIVVLYNLTDDLNSKCEFHEDFDYVSSIKLHGWDYYTNELITPTYQGQLLLHNLYYVWHDVECARTVYNLTYEVYSHPDPQNWGHINQLMGDNDEVILHFYHDKDRKVWYSTGEEVIQFGAYAEVNFNVSLDVDLVNWVYSLKYVAHDNGEIIQIVINASLNDRFMINPILRKVAINNFDDNDYFIDHVELKSSGGFVGDINLEVIPTIDEIRQIEAFEGSYEFAGFKFDQSADSNYRSDRFNYTRCDLEGYKYSTCPVKLLRDDVIKSSSNYVFDNFLYFIVFLLAIIIIVVIIVNVRKK